MKKIALMLSFLLLASCTQNSVVRNTALNQVITQFEDQLSKNPDPAKAEQIHKKTKIEVTDVKMISDDKAEAVVKISSVSPENLSQSVFQEVHLKLSRQNDHWSVDTEPK